MARRLRVTAIGHATMLIQTAGLNILTDPVWSERASPFAFAGPKRVRAPGLAFDELPKIDVVLVTHNHYDHLDIATLTRLAETHNPRVITPLGNDTIMRAEIPAIRAEAFDWGDSVDLGGGVTAALHPSRHWSARGPFDRNRALWAAFALKTPGGGIYHVGDSGYGDGQHFRTAREKYGPFRLAILPVGAYEPRWFMLDQHMNPDDAVKALADLGARRAIGHHFGTFQLTDEAIDAPAMALEVARKAANIAADGFSDVDAGRRVGVVVARPTTTVVMPGLDPGIHRARKRAIKTLAKTDSDCRVKPGNDGQIEATTCRPTSPAPGRGSPAYPPASSAGR